MPQGDVQLMTEKQILGRRRDLNRLARYVPSRWTIVSSKQVDDRKHRMDDALILAYCANPAGSNFREPQEIADAIRRTGAGAGPTIPQLQHA